MSIAAVIAIAFVAFQHVAFLVLEMFLWSKPTGRRVFRMSREQAESTRLLAANQGLYNGFLAAGLVWSLLPGGGAAIATFFTACVVVAGLFGGATVSKGILFVQAVPGAIALALVLVSRG